MFNHYNIHIFWKSKRIKSPVEASKTKFRQDIFPHFDPAVEDLDQVNSHAYRRVVGGVFGSTGAIFERPRHEEFHDVFVWFKKILG